MDEAAGADVTAPAYRKPGANLELFTETEWGSGVGRPARFSEEAILDAALEVLLDSGLDGMTIAAIAGRLGAPTGSIYHRFPSKAALTGQLWLRTMLRFREGFLEAIADPDVDEGARRVVRHMMEWARDNPAEGRLVAEHWNRPPGEDRPDELTLDMSTIDDRVGAALTDYCARRYATTTPDHLYVARFALLHLPYAAIHVFLQEGTPQPAHLEYVTAETSVHALSLAGTHS